MKIIECVPNISEGRDENILRSLKDSVLNIENCVLLNFESDPDYNRTVITLAGNEKGILEGVLSLTRAAAEKIDMQSHKGEHPRIGAVDVVPFIPIQDTTMEECIKISEKFGKIIGEELNVPVYLYEHSARIHGRKNLSNIRKCGYESLIERLKLEEWKPDYGPSEFNPKLGAVVTGARPYLIAYNVNIKESNVKFAKEIAEIVRESGSIPKDKNVNKEHITRKPGKLKYVKGLGIFLRQNNITQVSMNLTDYKSTPVHLVYEEVKNEAEILGVKVTGSELIGLVPKEALVEAGKYYSEGKLKDEEELIDLAVEKLGLNDLRPFKKYEKIIDYLIRDLFLS